MPNAQLGLPEPARGSPWPALPCGARPRGLDLVLLGLGFVPYFVLFKGRGQGGRVGESWVDQNGTPTPSMSPLRGHP